MAIILASASPRRRELLKFITEDFTVRVSDAEEVTDPDLSAEETVKSLAVIKGEAVADSFPDDTVISADTIVVLDGKILGKPKDEEDAFRMLSSLSGRTHEVFTGVCVLHGGKKTVFAEVDFIPTMEETELKDKKTSNYLLEFFIYLKLLLDVLLYDNNMH